MAGCSPVATPKTVSPVAVAAAKAAALEVGSAIVLFSLRLAG
jgi:hypothetical protein